MSNKKFSNTISNKKMCVMRKPLTTQNKTNSAVEEKAMG